MTNLERAQIEISKKLSEEFKNTLDEYMDTILDENGNIDKDKYIGFVKDFAALRGLELYDTPNFISEDLYNDNGMSFILVPYDINLHMRYVYGINATIQN